MALCPCGYRYFIGSGTHAAAQSFRTLELGQVYPGIRVSLNAHGNNVEKIYTLAPGVAGERIRMEVGGAQSLQVKADGSLALATQRGEVSLSAPVAWQDVDGRRMPVQVAYSVSGNGYGFKLGPHDGRYPVVIDPLLQATYLGGKGSDFINSILVHPANGDVYVAGYLKQNDPALDLAFPVGIEGGGVLKSAEEIKRQNNFEIGFIARFSPDLGTHKQTTLFGSAGANSRILQIVAHPQNGDVYAYGLGARADLPGMKSPTTPQYGEPAFRRTASSATYAFFISRFSPELTILRQSTQLPTQSNVSSLGVRKIGIHPSNRSIYAAGNSTATSQFDQFFEVPGLGSASYQSTCKGNDAFLLKISESLTTLEASTCFGGTGEETAADLGFHTDGDVYLLGTTGSTENSGFPTTPNMAQAAQGSKGTVTDDAYVAKLSADLKKLTNLTCLGGAGDDSGRSMAIDAANGFLYVAGTTEAADFPKIDDGSAIRSRSRFNDHYLTRLTADLTQIIQSTVLSNQGNSSDYKPLFHPNGTVYILGPFAGLNGAPSNRTGSGFRRFSADLRTLIEETFLTVDDTPHESVTGAVSSNGNGEIYVVGNQTGAASLPNVIEPSKAVGAFYDAFIARYSEDVSFDTDPNPFGFAPKTDVPLSSEQTSEAVTIAGINWPAPVKIENGSYSIGCNGSFTVSPSSVTGINIPNNQTVCVRHNASGRNSTATQTILTIGKVSGAFQTTTLAAPPGGGGNNGGGGGGGIDTTRQPDQTKTKAKAKRNRLVVVGQVKTKGLTAPTGIAISNGEYSVGCKRRRYTSAAGTVRNKQLVCVRHQTAAEKGGRVTSRLLVGDRLIDFTSVSK